MKGTLSLNGWMFVGSVRLRKGLLSSRYQHAQSNFTAEETFAGMSDRRLGLLIRDEKGKTIGIVQNVKELP